MSIEVGFASATSVFFEFWERLVLFGIVFVPLFCPNLNFFLFLLKLSAVCNFWIVLMC